MTYEIMDKWEKWTLYKQSYQEFSKNFLPKYIYIYFLLSLDES